jgi:hypothetical protein
MIQLTLRTARCEFTKALCALVTYAISLGYEVAFAEGMDRITAKDPTTDHMKGSNHEIGLAQDIDLYVKGVYLMGTEDHEPLGTWWEDYGVAHGLPLVWGGNFEPPDGNHYSLRWLGKS